MELHDCMELHGTAWNCMELHGTAWNGMERPGTAWNGMEQPSMANVPQRLQLENPTPMLLEAWTNRTNQVLGFHGLDAEDPRTEPSSRPWQHFRAYCARRLQKWTSLCYEVGLTRGELHGF